MRLIQLSTRSDEIVDLHPNVTVVSGLDDDGRRLLVDTVLGLARGSAAGSTGLLEAHGMLFDLTDEMLALLDVHGDGAPAGRHGADLPTVRNDPARARTASRRAGRGADRRAMGHRAGGGAPAAGSPRDEAAASLDHARRNADEAEAGTAERIRLIDELTGQLDQVDERRRRLLEEQAARGPEAEAAQARRLEVEAATDRGADPPPGVRHPVLGAGRAARPGPAGPRSRGRGRG